MSNPHNTSCVMCHVSCVTCHGSHVTCHKSCITCHVSHVMCHMACVACHIFFYFEAYWWRVCYQQGLPRLVFYLHTYNKFFTFLLLYISYFLLVYFSTFLLFSLSTLNFVYLFFIYIAKQIFGPTNLFI